MDFYDISLPRGDSTGVAGALCAAAIVVLGPWYALAISLMSAFGAHLIRRGPESLRRVFAVASSRAIAWGMASAILLTSLASESQALVFVVVPAVFLLVELLVAQGVAALITGRPLVRLLSGNAKSQAPLIAAQWSTAVLLLITYGQMRQWSLVPVVVLLLLMRQSYALFLDIRETYRATVEVLVEAAESQDERRAGHADRTAALARSIAMKIGLSASEVERISYAALLHDLGELAEGPDSDWDEHVHQTPSSDVVRGVEFFERIEPILRICDGADSGQSTDEGDLLAALVVSLASDIDAEYHPQVAAAHRHSLLDQVAHRVPASVKARAVGAALRLGYRIPAVS
ncbi:MAG: HD domain-containing protein [Coriobacteriia bacterium]|nr:HD domain-containing protein [Coriobacteriia bacterium]